MKRLVAFLFLTVVFLFITKTPVLAADPTPAAATPTSHSSISYKINDLAVGDNPELLYDLYNHPETRIDGNSRLVWVQFTNLDSGSQYAICAGYEKESCSNHFKPGSDGSITLSICGNGQKTVKGVQVQGFPSVEQVGGKLKEKCNESRDFFHEGHVYKVALYADYDDKADRPDPGQEGGEIIAAKFFVAHSYPLVKLNSSDISSQPIAITLWGRRPGGDTKNNYQVVVEGIDNGFKKEHCYTVPEKNWWKDNLTVGINTQWVATTGQPAHQEHILEGTGYSVPKRADDLGALHTFGRGKDESNGALGNGTYIAKINERVSDNRPFGFANNCEGGYTYMHVFFQIAAKKKELKILKVVYDPNNSDRGDISKVPPVPPIPCAAGEIDEDAGTCKAFNVALLGKVPLDPLAFIKSVYTFILSFAGIAAMAIIIRAGYKFMYSRGDKEIISQARSQLTSAIIGLAFIIFAYVILSVIGVDILRIPGFG
jgi:hypothetical protein